MNYNKLKMGYIMSGKKGPHVPKYSMVMMSLIDRINNDEFAPDYRLPSEKELIDAYSVSRITVRRALDEMETQNYIYKQQGKGSFVNKSRVDESVYTRYNRGFSALIESAGKTCTVQQITKEFRPAGACGGELLMDPQAKCLYYSRVYKADGVPVLYAESYINHQSLPGIENYDFTFISLSRLIRQVYGSRLYRRSRTIRSTKAEGAAAVLDVGPEDPVLQLTYTSNVDDGKQFLPFERAALYARTDIIPIDSEYL